MTTLDFLFPIKSYRGQKWRKVNINTRPWSYIIYLILHVFFYVEGIPSKGWEEIKSEPQPQYQPEDKKEMEAYKPPEEYKTPKEEYNPPNVEYNPPKEEYNPPKEEYNPPKEEYKTPKEEYKTPMELKEGKNLMNNDENIDIEKEIKMIDDNLRDMEKMFNNKKEDVEKKKEQIEEQIEEKQKEEDMEKKKEQIEEKPKEEMEVPADKTPSVSFQSAEGFKSEQSKYENFPTKPADTRRWDMLWLNSNFTEEIFNRQNQKKLANSVFSNVILM